MQNNAKRYVISLICNGKECFRLIALLEYNTSCSTHNLVDYQCRRMCQDWRCKLPAIASPPCNCAESVFEQWFDKLKEFAQTQKMDIDIKLIDIRPIASDVVCGVVSC